jgi:hypothetical protein
MINRIVLPIVFVALVLTFFLLEVSGRFPALPAVICMGVLWLAWRWFGPPRVETKVPVATPTMKRLNRISRVLWIAMGLIIVLVFIGGIFNALKNKGHGAPSSKAPATSSH